MAHPIHPASMKAPQHLANTVNAAYGRTVLDKWSMLDPALAERQLNAAAGAASFRKSGPLDRGITDPHWSPDGLAVAMGLSIVDTTLDPAKVTHAALSNGNLTLTGNTGGSYGFSISTVAHSTGKWHFEFTDVNEPADTNFAFGLAASLPVSAPGSDTTSIAGFNDTTATFFYWNNAGAGSISGVSFAAGQTAAVEVDFDAQRLWLQNVATTPGVWNGSGAANPATGVGGFSFAGKLASGVPYYMALNVGGNGLIGNAKFAAPFAVTPSAGFRPWSS